MFTVEYVKDLQWCDAENTMFSCVVKYEEFNEEMPAGINATDPYAHIQEIWTKGNAGDYGVIAEYVQPVPVVVVRPAEANKQIAQKLLQETDWITIADVADPALSNPYLTNQSDFFEYRSALRQIAVKPVAGNIDFPTKPNEVWSS